MNILLVVAFGLGGAVLGGVGRWWIRAVVRCPPPWCELASAALSAVVGWRTVSGALPWWWAALPLIVSWLAIPLIVTDLATNRLPDRITLPAYPLLAAAVALAATAGPEPTIALRALTGAALFGGAHAVVRLLVPSALGGGDVKLAGSLGAVLGAVGWAALALAVTLAAAVTVVLVIIRRTRAAPHGPGLLVATWLVAAFPAVHLPVPT